VRDRGHEVLVFAATAGPLADHVETLGLPPPSRSSWRRRPSPTIMSTLTELARGSASTSCTPTSGLRAWSVRRTAPARRRAVVATVMSMGVSPMIPSSTRWSSAPSRSRRRRAGGRGPVHVLEPPDEHRRPTTGHPRRRPQGPGSRSIPPGRRSWSCRAWPPSSSARGSSGRSTRWSSSISAGSGPQLLVVGDGPDRARIDDRARAVNGRLGGPRVVLAGELLDPRPAYALADVVLGMGGSALRAMAFAKPLVVLGERGFSEVLEPHTWEQFLWSGFFGIGDGDRRRPARRPVRSLLADPNRGRARRSHSAGGGAVQPAQGGRGQETSTAGRSPRRALRSGSCSPSVARRGARAGVEGGPRLPVGAGGRRLQRSRGVGPHGGVAGAAPGPTATPDRS